MITAADLYAKWQGEEVFIIGGGPSVKDFPTQLLSGKHVIGVNDAYQFKESNVCYFSDLRWYNLHKRMLQNWCGLLVTNHPRLKDEPSIIWFPREIGRFATTALGHGGNSGYAAINLALIMGASYVYLIGFDMAVGPNGETNWHPNPLNNPTEEDHYTAYRQEFENTRYRDIWPGAEILNLNPQSKLGTFPKISWKQILSEARK